MRKKEHLNSIIEICPVRNVVARFGNKWALLVILVLSEAESTRYNDLLRKIPDISSRVLASTLKNLLADGLVFRNSYQEVPPRVEYGLTDTGRTLVPIILQLTDWAQKNMKTIIEHRRAAQAMSKPLQEMTLEELWELFPITLEPHRPEWAEWAREEIDALSEVLRAYAPTVTHVGSTAIEGIKAKPIVDILVEVGQSADFEDIRVALEQSGYTCMAAAGKRMSFNKGYTPQGYAERVFHVHLRRAGDNDEIAFRDYLRAHPEAASRYERLKKDLAERYCNNRDAYTEAKTDFVAEILRAARS